MLRYTCEIENLTKAHPTDAGYDLRSIEDLTKTKKWKVSKISEKEAISNGYIKIEE